MSNTAAIEPERPKKRSHHSPKTAVRRGRPRNSSLKGSHTSPRKLHRRKRMDEALGFREQGYTFDQIAKQMKCSISVAHGYVVEGMNLIPMESAKTVLAMELKRLDGLFSAHYENATNGDLAATSACLAVIDKRCKLLGLFPKENGPSLLISAPDGGDGQRPLFQIEFIMPTAKPVEPEPYEPSPRPWQKALPAPAPKLRLNEWGDLVDDA